MPLSHPTASLTPRPHPSVHSSPRDPTEGAILFQVHGRVAMVLILSSQVRTFSRRFLSGFNLAELADKKRPSFRKKCAWVTGSKALKGFMFYFLVWLLCTPTLLPLFPLYFHQTRVGWLSLFDNYIRVNSHALSPMVNQTFLVKILIPAPFCPSASKKTSKCKVIVAVKDLTLHRIFLYFCVFFTLVFYIDPIICDIWCVQYYAITRRKFLWPPPPRGTFSPLVHCRSLFCSSLNIAMSQSKQVSFWSLFAHLGMCFIILQCSDFFITQWFFPPKFKV